MLDIRNKLSSILLTLLLLLPVSAAGEGVPVWSLLTCEPGTEVYQLFGHTALRMRDAESGRDLVFNYGMFSFDAPNFRWRFTRGETDYSLGITPFKYFEYEYALRGSNVTEQILDLEPDEALRLRDLLFENYKPENRVYRYNYFYDNCTTRARDMIEKSVDGLVEYPEALGNDKSLRDVLHEFAHGWNRLGIDLLLGWEADLPASGRQQMFAPLYLMRDMSSAVAVRDGVSRPLVKSEKMAVVTSVEKDDEDFPLTPAAASAILLMLCLAVLHMAYHHGWPLWPWESFLLILQGLAGLIISFLVFFSVHPAVGSNVLVWFFNPLPLLLLPFVIYNDIKNRCIWFHYVNMAWAAAFLILCLFTVQFIPLMVYVLASCLLLTSVTYIFIYRKK